MTEIGDTHQALLLIFTILACSIKLFWELYRDIITPLISWIKKRSEDKEM